jgi:hypothetical protein
VYFLKEKREKKKTKQPPTTNHSFVVNTCLSMRKRARQSFQGYDIMTSLAIGKGRMYHLNGTGAPNLLTRGNPHPKLFGFKN